MFLTSQSHTRTLFPSPPQSTQPLCLALLPILPLCLACSHRILLGLQRRLCRQAQVVACLIRQAQRHQSSRVRLLRSRYPWRLLVSSPLLPLYCKMRRCNGNDSVVDPFDGLNRCTVVTSTMIEMNFVRLGCTLRDSTSTRHHTQYLTKRRTSSQASDVQLPLCNFHCATS